MTDPTAGRDEGRSPQRAEGQAGRRLELELQALCLPSLTNPPQPLRTLNTLPFHHGSFSFSWP